MKIGTKLFLSLAIPTVVVIALLGYIYQRHSREVLREELAREGLIIARTVQAAVENALRDRQSEDVRQLVDRLTLEERILGVRIFNPSDELSYQSDELKGKPLPDRTVLGE